MRKKFWKPMMELKKISASKKENFRDFLLEHILKKSDALVGRV
jgi:hypothetical protein